MYVPSTGRFLTRDPLPQHGVDVLYDHAYVYARNNPVKEVDPSGALVGYTGSGRNAGRSFFRAFGLPTKELTPIFLRAKWFPPQIARFTPRDQLGDSISAYAIPYAYVQNQLTCEERRGECNACVAQRRLACEKRGGGMCAIYCYTSYPIDYPMGARTTCFARCDALYQTACDYDRMLNERYCKLKYEWCKGRGPDPGYGWWVSLDGGCPF